MRYLTTNSDGKHTEGIGAMVQYQIICYLISKIYNYEYVFSGFKNLTHYQHNSIDKNEWNVIIDTFFNFNSVSKLPQYSHSILIHRLEDIYRHKTNSIFELTPKLLMNIADFIIDSSENYLAELSDNIIFDINDCYFDSNVFNVSFHIRRFTKTDCEPDREYFTNDNKLYYEKLLISVLSILKKIDCAYSIHIYSQGKVKDFYFLKMLDDNITLHIDEIPTISVYHMVHSDLLICANSSLSYISHLLNKNNLFLAKSTFFHKWKLGTISVDDAGNFNEELLFTKIMEKK